jgi:hypothetical protein
VIGLQTRELRVARLEHARDTLDLVLLLEVTLTRLELLFLEPLECRLELA